MIKNTKKAVAVLGGMSPDASAGLYQRMIELARGEFGAKENEDYPEIILHSIPVPDFITHENKLKQSLTMLTESVEKLSQADVCCVGLVCNTAHVLLPQLQRLTDAPFLSLPDLVLNEAKKSGYSRLGLLASPTTYEASLYNDAFASSRIELMVPRREQISELGEVITHIVAGDMVVPRERLIKIADDLKLKRAEAIILGCTELPLVFPKNYSLPVLDSLEVLSRALLSKYYSQEGV